MSRSLGSGPIHKKRVKNTRINEKWELQYKKVQNQ